MNASTNLRPRSITVISVICVAFAAITLLANFLPRLDGSTPQPTAEPNPHHPLMDAFIYVIRAAPILSGVFMLSGRNWARWLLVAWIAFHIVIGFWHSLGAGLVHALLFGVILFFLFRPLASAYFRGTPTVPTTSPDQPPGGEIH